MASTAQELLNALEVCRILLKCGADPRIATRSENTTFHVRELSVLMGFEMNALEWMMNEFCSNMSDGSFVVAWKGCRSSSEGVGGGEEAVKSNPSTCI